MTSCFFTACCGLSVVNSPVDCLDTNSESHR
nr:MAG TPA: hypothetical protein [Caudoviricetes sp.]